MAIVWFILLVFATLFAFLSVAILSAPFLILAAVFCVPFLIFGLLLLLLWFITENVLLSIVILAVIFSLIWFLGGDTEEIKKELARQKELAKQHR